MLTLEVRRRPGTGAEMHRVSGPSATVGASSGNEVVVRARGVYGRHLRLLEKDGVYHLDLFRGIAPVQVNGREFSGARSRRATASRSARRRSRSSKSAPSGRTVPIEPGEAESAPAPSSSSAAPAPGTTPAPAPVTEVEYRGLRITAYRLCREAQTAEDLATDLTDFLDRELAPSEWAVGEFSAAAGFRPLASTFRESPALPPPMTQEIRAGERLARSESVTGVLTLIVEPATDGAGRAAILVRESPRLAARAILFLEELAQLAGVAFAGVGGGQGGGEAAVPAPRPSRSPAPPVEASPAETVLRSTDDLKKIVETVEREVIDRAMRRVEGNQSRGRPDPQHLAGLADREAQGVRNPGLPVSETGAQPEGLVSARRRGVAPEPPPQREGRREAARDLVEMEGARPGISGEGAVVGPAPFAEPRGVEGLDLEDQGERRGSRRAPPPPARTGRTARARTGEGRARRASRAGRS